MDFQLHGLMKLVWERKGIPLSLDYHKTDEREKATMFISIVQEENKDESSENHAANV